MARAISDEEQQLKRRARRRLIGAIVLVAGIVVVLPMVLDSEPKRPGQPVAVQIPSLDATPFRPKAAAPAAQPAPKSEAASGVPAADAGQAARSEPKPDKPASGAAPRPTIRPAQSASATDRPSDGRYVVQVIALADAGRAKRLQQKISAAGIQSFTEIVKTQKGDVTRVRAGPFATREEAEKAREQLKKLGMSGNITSK